MKLFIHDPGSFCEGVPDTEHELIIDLPDSEFTEQRRKDIKDAVDKMFGDLDITYEHLHMNFEDECEECGLKFQPQNLEKKKCIRCENFYQGFERHEKNETLLRAWREYNAGKIIKRDGKTTFLNLGIELPQGLCVSCWTPVPIEEWYRYAPSVLCKKCGKGLGKNSFARDRSQEAELGKSALNLGRP